MRSHAALDSHSANPSGLPVAPLGRTGLWLPAHFIPPRWPFAVGAVGVVACLLGLGFSVARAPVGNLVHLEVVAASPHAHPAAHAVEAALVRQLRAMRLDVGGARDDRVAAMVARVTVDSAPDARVRFGTLAEAYLDVKVTDDDAGGMALVTAHGTGEDPARAEMAAADQLAVELAGRFAALVAPQQGPTTTIRRVTDGRGSLRVFARTRSELMADREGRVATTVRARAGSTRLPMVQLPAGADDARLVGVVGNNTALVVRGTRDISLAPTTRHVPLVVEGADVLGTWTAFPANEFVPIATAWHVVGAAVDAVDADHFDVAWLARHPDGHHEACLATLDMPAHAATPATCVDLPDGAHATLGALHRRLLLVTQSACARGCEVVARTVDLSAGEVLDEGRVPVAASMSGAPAGASWWMPLPTGGGVGLVEADKPARRWQLVRRGPDEWTYQPLTVGPADERNPYLSRDGKLLFFETVHPDPDADGVFRAVQAIQLGS